MICFGALESELCEACPADLLMRPLAIPQGGRVSRFVSALTSRGAITSSALHPSALSELESGVGSLLGAGDAAWHKEVCHAEEVYRSAYGGRTP